MNNEVSRFADAMGQFRIIKKIQMAVLFNVTAYRGSNPYFTYEPMVFWLILTTQENETL